MVQPARPVHGNVRLLLVELHRTSWGGGGGGSQSGESSEGGDSEGGEGALPIEPPAESWQNSYMPSNTGQSSPTLTAGHTVYMYFCITVSLIILQ